MRLGASEFSPIATAFVRVCVAALFLLPLMLWQGHKAVFNENWRLTFSVGVVNSALPFSFFAYAVMHISTGLSSILNAAVPLFAALVAWLWLGDRLTTWRVLGLCIGFLGVLLLAGDQTGFQIWGQAGTPHSPPDTHQFTAVVACMAATLCYALSASFTKRHLPSLPPLVIATGSQCGGALALALPALWGMPNTMPSLQAILALSFLGVACTGIAYVLYFRLIARAGPARALTVTFLIPVFAITYGVVFLGEKVTLNMLLFTGVIIFGTALSSGSIKKK